VSNFLAVATVTATLQRILQGAISADVPGATATVDRPLTTAVAPKPAVNIYLYQVSPNAAWRNADLPTRNGDGAVVHKPQAALDLHYLLNFYGDDSQLEPQRLLGSTVRTLHAVPVLPQNAIAAVIAAASVNNNPIFPFLKNSDLGAQIDSVRFTPQTLNVEDLSKIWSVFPDVPYTLSAAYLASVVLIEENLTPKPAIPVLTRGEVVGTFRRPVVLSIEDAAGPDKPIMSGSTLRVRGQSLSAPITLVRVAGVDEPPSQVNDFEMLVSLTSLPTGTLRAGVQPFQVIQQLMLGNPPTPHAGVESEVAPFVLHPAVVGAGLPQPPVLSGGVYSGSVRIKCDINVGPSQRAVLLLGAPPSAALRYIFPAPPLAAAGDTLTFPVSGVAPGTYVVRVQIDGAASPVVVDPAHEVKFP
jgi:hypothetical protein